MTNTSQPPADWQEHDPDDGSVAYWLGRIAQAAQTWAVGTNPVIEAMDCLGVREKDDPSCLTAGGRYVEWRFADDSTADGLLRDRDGELRLGILEFRNPDGRTVVEVTSMEDAG